MKKIFFILSAAGCIALATINRTNAQGPDNAVISKNNKVETAATAATHVDAPYSKVLKKLSRMYKNIPVKSWTKSEEGYWVEFISKGVKSRILYDTTGKWTASIKSYAEDKLSNEIKNAVKNKYHYYTILRVEEVETIESNGTPTYIIRLEDKTNFKVVRFYEGQIEVRQEFEKS